MKKQRLEELRKLIYSKPDPLDETFTIRINEVKAFFQHEKKLFFQRLKKTEERIKKLEKAYRRKK